MNWLRSKEIVTVKEDLDELARRHVEQDKHKTREAIARLESVTEQIRLTTLELKMLVAHVAREEGLSIEDLK